MLGHEDDISSVSALLDQLSLEFESSKRSLEELCALADEMSSQESTLPVASDDEIKQLESEAFAISRHLKTTSLELKAVVERIVHKSAQQTADLTKNHGNFTNNVLEWQNRIEAASDESLKLEQLNLEVDKQLCKLTQQLARNAA